LGGGFGCLALAAFVQGILPMLEPESLQSKVTTVVRTDLGELKWIEAQATDYTELQALGRQVYTREGCWYCHSQFVRPVTGETRRWGPVSQSGESVFDTPHLFSTRRIGPDLSRVGLKFSDEWHLAHFWDPRMVVPDSIMPRFAQLFDTAGDRVRIVDDDQGNRTLERTPATEAFFDFESQDRLNLTPNAEGLLFVPERGRYPVILTPNDEYDGETVQLIATTRELDGLIAYLQKLGMNRGKWRDVFAPQRMEASQVSLPRSEEWIAYGKEVYDRRCAGCHGANGNGNGPAATFMYEFRPRDFTLGLFKFTLTPSGSMPSDGDLLRTITRGIRGTAMPPWHMLPDKDRLAVIQYIKYELSVDRSNPGSPYAYFEEEPLQPPIFIERPPTPSEALLARGEEVWQEAKCWECHGQTGEGDGEKAAGLTDDWGFPIRPADLTTGQFKSGAGVDDIYRTMTNGLSGTPMPGYGRSLPEEDRWALSYYVLALSAYKDPLTGEPLEISEADRAALNDPALKATESHYAYQPQGDDTPSSQLAVKPDAATVAGEVWAERHGVEIVPAADAAEPAAAVD
jgi:cytochrome c oxidase cbb3-type subunit 2